MAVVKNSPGYQVDGRVLIALDALADSQKQVVGGMISNRAQFLASTADSRKVRKISKDQPLYTLRVPSGLRIVYSKVGDEIVVLDLMRQATLDHYGPKVAKAGNSGTKKIRAMTQSKKAK